VERYLQLLDDDPGEGESGEGRRTPVRERAERVDAPR
jgi:hypothetical protein